MSGAKNEGDINYKFMLLIERISLCQFNQINKTD